MATEFVVFDMEHTGWSVESIRLPIATTPDTTVRDVVKKGRADAD